MKYCFNFYKDSEYLNEIDEINISFSGREGQFENLMKFLELHKTQKVNIIISVEDFDQFFAVDFTNLLEGAAAQYRLGIRFYDLGLHPYADWKPDPRILSFIPKVPSASIYFGILAFTFEHFYEMKNYGVKEIYVSGDLGFNLNQLKDSGIILRAIPNVAQSFTNATEPLLQFFIRPNDTELYDKYINVFEICGKNNAPSVIYKAYVDGDWFGPLDEIIYGLNCDIDNTAIIPVFGMVRRSCAHSCMINNKCSICQNIYKINQILKEKNLIIMNSKADQ